MDGKLDRNLRIQSTGTWCYYEYCVYYINIALTSTKWSLSHTLRTKWKAWAVFVQSLAFFLFPNKSSVEVLYPFFCGRWSECISNEFHHNFLRTSSPGATASWSFALFKCDSLWQKLQTIFFLNCLVDGTKKTNKMAITVF